MDKQLKAMNLDSAAGMPNGLRSWDLIPTQMIRAISMIIARHIEQGRRQIPRVIGQVNSNWRGIRIWSSMALIHARANP